MRAIARATTASIGLFSRNLREITSFYPEIAAVLAEITDGRTVLLDGELRRPRRVRRPVVLP
ncbi:hypothetical protein ACT86A_27400, partial [Nocardia sp. R6R-6]